MSHPCRADVIDGDPAKPADQPAPVAPVLYTQFQRSCAPGFFCQRRAVHGFSVPNRQCLVQLLQNAEAGQRIALLPSREIFIQSLRTIAGMKLDTGMRLCACRLLARGHTA